MSDETCNYNTLGNNNGDGGMDIHTAHSAEFRI